MEDANMKKKTQNIMLGVFALIVGASTSGVFAKGYSLQPDHPLSWTLAVVSVVGALMALIGIFICYKELQLTTTRNEPRRIP